MDSNSFSLLTNFNLSYLTSLSLPETVSRLLPVDSCKKHSLQPKSSNGRTYVTNCVGSDSSRKIFFKPDESNTTALWDSNSSSRENLISLFKRIQLEISQEESVSRNYSKSSQVPIGDGSVETSVLEILQQSDRAINGDNSRLKLSKDFSHNTKSTEKEKSVPITQPPSTNNFTRPPSKFVKKSPIPSSTPSKRTDVELKVTELPSSEADKGSSSIERMKVSELKEVAKGRGIKGYSKLKKNDLIQLLKS